MLTEVEIEIADGSYTCALGLQGIREIERAAGGDGIGLVIARTLKGRMASMGDPAMGVARETMGITIDAEYRIDEVISIVRQGLIAGGKGIVDGAPVRVDMARANQLVSNYLLPPIGTLDRLWTLAAFIALNLAEGYEPPKKKEVSPVKVASKQRRRTTATTPA